MANKVTPDPVADVPAMKFELERLRKDCLQLFGVTFSTFDGVVHGLAEHSFTIQEMQEAIDQWHNTRVIPEEKKEAI